MSPPPAMIVVMGVSACGKSSVGKALAQDLQAPFVDGDDLHPPYNIAKMSRGDPLNDQDRLPWLQSIRKCAQELTSPAGLSAINHPREIADLADGPSEDHLTYALKKITPETLGKPMRASRPVVVVGCSALRRPYRDILRGKRADCGNGVVCEVAEGEGEDRLHTYFIYLDGSKELLLNRLRSRKGHFMKSDMLDSQLATLEVPTSEEGEVAHVKLGTGEGETEEVGLAGITQQTTEIAHKWVGPNEE